MSYFSKYTGACIASMTCSTALVTRGPIPSPGIKVTGRGAPSPGRGMLVTDRRRVGVEEEVSRCFRTGMERLAIGSGRERSGEVFGFD